MINTILAAYLLIGTITTVVTYCICVNNKDEGVDRDIRNFWYLVMLMMIWPVVWVWTWFLLFKARRGHKNNKPH